MSANLMDSVFELHVNWRLYRYKTKLRLIAKLNLLDVFFFRNLQQPILWKSFRLFRDKAYAGTDTMSPASIHFLLFMKRNLKKNEEQ